MTPVIIETYSDTYKKAIQNLIIPIQQEFQVDIDIERQPDLLDIPNFYQKENGNFWIAKSGDSVVGTISLLDIGNNQAALRKMFVHRDFRGKEYGVGQQLLNTAFHWAQSKGIKEIFLGTTEKFLAAHRFYEKNGFTEIGQQELPQNFPVVTVDVKFYVFKMR